MLGGPGAAAAGAHSLLFTCADGLGAEPELQTLEVADIVQDSMDSLKPSASLTRTRLGPTDVLETSSRCLTASFVNASRVQELRRPRQTG